MKPILIIFTTFLLLANSCKEQTKTITISPEEGKEKLLTAEDIFNLRWVDTLMPIRKAKFSETKNKSEKWKKYSYVLDYTSDQNPIYGKMESNTFFFEKLDTTIVNKIIAEHNKTSYNGIEYLIRETDEFNLPFESCKTFALLNPYNRDFKGFTINYIKDNKLIQSKILFNKFFPIDWDIAVSKLKKL